MAKEIKGWKPEVDTEGEDIVFDIEAKADLFDILSEADEKDIMGWFTLQSTVENMFKDSRFIKLFLKHN